MAKTEAKKVIKAGIYDALYEQEGIRDDNMREIVFRVLDNIPEKVLQRAINKGTR